MEEILKSWRWRYLAIILAIGFLVRVNSLPGTFIYDDIPIVRDNPLVKGNDIGAIFSSPYWNEGGRGLFRPITIFTFYLNYLWHDSNPLWYHIDNILLHLFNTSLLYLLLNLISPLSYRSMALIALLFCLHPMTVEPVNSLVGRAELLVGTATLTSLLLFFLFLKERIRQPMLVVLLPAAFLLGLLAKENGVLIIPLLFAAYFTYRIRNPIAISRQQLWAPFFALLATLVGVVLWRSQVLDSLSPDAVAIQVGNWKHHVIVACQVAGKSLANTLWPWRYQWDYAPYAIVPAHSILSGDALFGALTICLTAAWSLATPFWTIGIILGWFLIGLLTSLQFIPIGALFAERFLYLPLLVAAVAAGILLNRRSQIVRMRVLLPIFVITLLAFGIRIVTANPLWKTEMAFWVFTQKQAEKSLSANLNLGLQYRQVGDYKQAASYIEKAIALAPSTSLAYGYLGAVYLDMRRFNDAEQAFLKIIQLQPDHAGHYNGLAVSRIGLHDYDGAKQALLNAIRLKPNERSYRENLIKLMGEHHYWDELDLITLTWEPLWRDFGVEALQRIYSCPKEKMPRSKNRGIVTRWLEHCKG